MPIIVARSSTGTPPPVQLPDRSYASLTYYDPSGTAWPLTDPDGPQFALADGIAGIGAAAYELTKDAHPRGGSRLRHVQPLERIITLPLLVQGADHMEFITRWRALARAFTRTLREGPGVLEFARPDGSRRQIDCVYEGGFDTSGAAYSGITSDTMAVSLYCEDPYWVDPVPQVVHREYDGAADDFFVPYPSISSGQVLGSTTVENPGDVDVWPIWNISGPAAGITFTHADSGEAFTLTPSAIGQSLTVGESVTVNTDPVSVRANDGSNWVGALNWPGAILWGLRPGLNSVSFVLGSADVGSAVDLVYHPRYETA